LPISTHELNLHADMSESLSESVPPGPANGISSAQTDEADGSMQRLAVVREEIEVQRERTVTGAVRVRVEPTLRTQSIDLTAMRTQVDIERVAVGLEVDAALPPWQDGDVWVVPVYEETVVVKRRLVLKEELRLHQRHRSEPVLQEVQLRRDEVHIERLDADGRWVAAPALVSGGPAVVRDLPSSGGIAGATPDL
jgi:uncharacterized protein (TIGR02271 family)